MLKGGPRDRIPSIHYTHRLKGAKGAPEQYTSPYWYACYTHGRHEKQVQRLLTRSGIENYLPMRAERRKWSDRLKEVTVPVFPSYIFVRSTLDRLWRVLDTPGVATVVRSHGYPTPVPDAEIEQVQRVLEGAMSAQTTPVVSGWVEKGDPVRVIRGSVRGVEGVVVQLRGHMHVLVLLTAIGRGLAVQVPADDLLRVERPASDSGRRPTRPPRRRGGRLADP